MPDFHLDEEESLALTLFLATDDPGIEVPADIDATVGREIFEALNCAGCHHHPDVEPRRNGPDLSRVGSRVREAWLREWLADPSAVRPFGFRPGSGGRMPDFRLTAAEVDSIATYLLSTSAGDTTPRVDAPLPAARDPAEREFEPRTLSTYEREKAESLLRDRLSCLGCHRLGADGGRIGPDLARSEHRLRPGYLHAVIRDPKLAAPGTIMPRVPMTTERRHLIASYLASGVQVPAAEGEREEAARAGGEEAETDRAGYLSLVDHRPAPPASEGPDAGSADSEAATGEALYGTHCAVCHGREGEGDGYNARYLPVPPTAHAYGPYMESRPGSTLYDGIHAGGRILNRSHRMPPFGESLEPAQIRSLVDYMRELCDCVGPAWSR